MWCKRDYLVALLGLSIGGLRKAPCEEVTIEGDPLTVIRKVRSPLHDASSIEAYIQDVKAMAPLFHRCFFAHASRDGNTVAYLLATTGLRCGGCSYLSGVVPEDVSLAVEWDHQAIGVNKHGG
ncbi:hypothetical protein J1N35_005008 [Gossypium stocksii]|uniref:RNase H type-1 domain-containing protein n=1 Tax=Gossypium stocksii TaxID=47602 RepID=A0A9D4AIK3_9ROSI|nr:hypothetical protein J1N35_005008 [Gossypium stocksii]